MRIGVVSIIHPRYHGKHHEDASYLVDMSSTPENVSWGDLSARAQAATSRFPQLHPYGHPHPSIRNYNPVARTLGIELITEWTSDDGACYAVLHTWIIRMVQRKWRDLLDQKRLRLAELSTLSALEYQRIHGKSIPTKLRISPWWKSRYPWMT